MAITLPAEFLDPPASNVNALVGGGFDDRDVRGGGLPGGTPDPRISPAIADAGQPDTTNTNRQTVGPDGYYVDASGQPTGGRPLTVEEKSFQESYPNGGSFSNPLAAQTQAYSTAVANGANPTSQPLTIEQQHFQGLYPNGGSFPNVSPIAANAQPAGGGGMPGGTNTGSGPQAMAAGPGWVIDAHGQFRSSNDGANITANRPFAGESSSIGPGTIIGHATPGNGSNGPGMEYGYGGRNTSPFDSFLTGQDYANAGHGLPGGLGMPGGSYRPDLQPNATPAGYPPATGGFQNYNPQLGETPQRTYGTGTGSPTTGGAGAPGAALSDAQRIHHGAKGDIYVADPDGYMAPNGMWSSKNELLTNIFDPGAREKLNVLARLGDMDAKTVLSGLPSDIGKSQGQADWIAQHNPIVQRTGIGDLVNPLSNPMADTSAFPVEYKLISAMKADGVNVSEKLVNGNIAYIDTNGETKYIPGWRAGQLLEERAAAAGAATPPPSGNGNGYGGYTPPYTPPAASVGLPPQPSLNGNAIIPSQWGGYPNGRTIPPY